MAERHKTVAQDARRRVRAFPARRNVAFQGRRASVLVPLVADEGDAPAGLAVLLTLRAATLNAHGGEVSLPGGKQDLTDVDDVDTALREAHEEIGLERGALDVLGCLDQFISKHMLLVTPVVALVRSPFTTHANTAEVGAIFTVPLDLFLRAGPQHSATDIDWGGSRHRMHSFDWDGFRIWGLTASVLIHAASVVYGARPAFEVDPPGAPSESDRAHVFVAPTASL
eukprot:Unigene14916_Nuclearia_a/m.44791 Unigene14916_Nuclearia_a/g.44791  ORF Unigene14916_Nuclearia_a/g.44791 Unigene14916_Nuclearia_a/m.44791 type:complete len:226 (+) Unigene14916_Nuclearia_a:2-679(+)